MTIHRPGKNAKQGVILGFLPIPISPCNDVAVAFQPELSQKRHRHSIIHICFSRIMITALSYGHSNTHLVVCQNLVPLVNIKIAGKWMFIPIKMVLIGIDPYPFKSSTTWGSWYPSQAGPVSPSRLWQSLEDFSTVTCTLPPAWLVDFVVVSPPFHSILR